MNDSSINANLVLLEKFEFCFWSFFCIQCNVVCHKDTSVGAKKRKVGNTNYQLVGKLEQHKRNRERFQRHEHNKCMRFI